VATSSGFFYLAYTLLDSGLSRELGLSFSALAIYSAASASSSFSASC